MKKKEHFQLFPNHKELKLQLDWNKKQNDKNKE